MNSTIKRPLTTCCFLLVALGSIAVASAEQPEAQFQQQQVEQEQHANSNVREPLAMTAEPELLFELRGRTQYADDSSFDALSDDGSYDAGTLGAGYGLGQILPGLRAHALYLNGGTSQSRFNGAARLDWHRHLLMAAADWGPELYGTIRPSVRLGAGYALQSLEVQTTGESKDDYAHDLAALGAFGLDVYTPRGFLGRFRLGVISEIGYIAQTPATFDELHTDGDDSWTRNQASLGDLHTSGLFWDLGLGLRVEL